MAKNPGGRPRKPTPKRRITASVKIMQGTDNRAKWLVVCSKHGLVSKHRWWHNAATAQYKHQGQHRE